MTEKKQGKRGPRPVTLAGNRLRQVMAANIKALIDVRYPLENYKNESARQRDVAKDVGVSWSTIQRAMDVKKGLTIYIVADIASGLVEHPKELLDREFARRIATDPSKYRSKPSAPPNDDEDSEFLQRRRRK